MSGLSHAAEVLLVTLGLLVALTGAVGIAVKLLFGRKKGRAMPTNQTILQVLLGLRDKLEAMEDRQEAIARMLSRIARHLAEDSGDREQAKRLSAELAAAASELEAAVTKAE